MRNLILLVGVVILYIDQSYSQNTGGLDITSNSTVQFIVTDPLGRRTGEDPRGVDNPYQGKRLEEIPNGNYSTDSNGDNPSADSASQSVDFGFEFGVGISSPENDGVYTIETIGTELGKYSLEIIVTPENESTLQRFRQDIEGLTDKDQVTRYRFSYNGAVGAPVKFEKLVTQRLLRKDLDNSFKLKLLGNNAFYKILSETINRFHESLSAHDTATAHITLQNYWHLISAVPRGNDTTASQFVLADAYTILQTDLNAFLKKLPAIPPLNKSKTKSK